MALILQVLAAILVLCHSALGSPAEQAKALFEARRGDIDNDVLEVLPNTIFIHAVQKNLPMATGRFTVPPGFLYNAKATAVSIFGLTSLRLQGVSAVPMLTLASPNAKKDESVPVALKVDFEIPKTFVGLLIEIVNHGLLKRDKGYLQEGHAQQDFAVKGTLAMKGLVSGTCLKISTIDDVIIAQPDMHWGQDFKMRVGSKDTSGIFVGARSVPETAASSDFRERLFSDLQLENTLRKILFGNVRTALTGKSYCKEE